MSLEKFTNILGAETVKKIYEDGLSDSVKETGKISTDLIKGLRLFTAPIQFMGAYQDRLTKHLDKVRNGVPEEKQIEAPNSLSAPILERLKFLEETDYLTELYITLLQKAINKDDINQAHPAFFHIIEQLSPDEAFLLYSISRENILYDYTLDLKESDYGVGFENQKITYDSIPKSNLKFVEHFDMYISHLESLNLLKWIKVNEEPIFEHNENENVKKQSGTFIKTKIYLTKFGELFVKACIPQKGLLIFNT